MELSQIKGAGNLVPGDFYPVAPRVDRESETANKTKIVVFKPFAISELFYIDPVTKDMDLCEPINTANYTFELNARNATNPFIVLVTYDYVNKQIVVRQSAAAAVPAAPEKGVGEFFLSSFIEQPIGTAQTGIPAIPSAVKTRTLSKSAGAYTDVIDFQYISTFLTLTGNITVNDPAIITGDSLPTGKTIKVILPASFSITWGSNYIPSRLGAVLSTTVGEINEILIWKNDTTGKYMYNIIVYSTVPFNYFKTRTLSKGAGTYSDVVDFQYISTFLTLTGNITVNDPAIITGDSLPTGKTIKIIVAASAYSITWGSNYIPARTGAVLSTTTGEINEILLWKNDATGKYMYNIVVYSATPLDYFKTRLLSKAAGTYTDVVDFQYAKTNLTLTGNITVNAPVNLTGDSIRTGKVILIRVAASAYIITFSSDYKPSKAAMPQSTTTGDVNAISIWYDEIASKYLYDIIVY